MFYKKKFTFPVKYNEIFLLSILDPEKAVFS